MEKKVGRKSCSSCKKEVDESVGPVLRRSSRNTKKVEDSELDIIFAKGKSLKRKSKPEDVKVERASLASKRRKALAEGGFADSRGTDRNRKRTDDGLRVFTEDELGISNQNAGDTPLCPFDCDCCH